jgi:hypothetical protein
MIIHRFVATVDNLPRRASRHAIAGRRLPLVTSAADGISIGPNNASRYTAYVQVAGGLTPRI